MVHRTFVAIAGALTAPAFAFAAEREETGRFSWWMPEDVSTHGHEIDLIFNVILYLTGITCIGVFAAMIIFLVKYRHNEGRHATFIHGNNKLETVWTLIPTVLMALIAAFSQTTWSKVKYVNAMPTGDDVVYVDIIGKQFKWYFHYPGADGEFGARRMDLIDLNASQPAEIIGLDREGAGRDDVVLDKMVIPVNRKVRSRITSVDVLHSFFLPNFRVKQDAVPGLDGNIWLEATKTSAEVVGRDPNFPLLSFDEDTYEDVFITDAKPFDVICAELCGNGHYTMRGLLFVVTEAQYEKFIKVEQNNAKIRAEEE